MQSMEFKTLATQESEKKLFLNRIIFSIIVIVFLIVALLLRLIQLQIFESDQYKLRSMNNTIRTYSVPATRGFILDRNQLIIAENQPVFQLEMIPEQVNDMDATLQNLIEHQLININKVEDIKNNIERHYQFKSIVLNTKLSDVQMATFANNRMQYKGVDIKPRLSRYYPKNKTFAHALGYVGAISSQDYQTVDASLYTGQEQIGKTSIERDFEPLLHGIPGNEKVLVNVRGKVMENLEKTPYQSGHDLILTLDAKLQETAFNAMKNRKGAVVGIDPTNGEILIFVSTPSFDPNLFSRGISSSEYRSLQTNKNKPLFNRAIAGQYPPGSTIKPIIALAGLQQGFIDPTKLEPCDGAFYLPNYSRPFNDWREHGPVNVKEAIQASCDVFFYRTAINIGITSTSDFLKKFNLGSLTGIDISYEKSGVVPNPEWKKTIKNQNWYPGDTVNNGIGQGDMLATPLQLAIATTIIANKGKAYQPHLVKGIKNTQTKTIEPVPLSVLTDITDINNDHWNIIHQGMSAVINQRGGTAFGIFENNYPLAGKTGSSQLYSIEKTKGKEIPDNLKDHGLFIGFSPLDNPKIALAIIVENGVSGRTAAAPIAKEILDVFLDREKP